MRTVHKWEPFSFDDVISLTIIINYQIIFAVEKERISISHSLVPQRFFNSFRFSIPTSFTLQICFFIGMSPLPSLHFPIHLQSQSLDRSRDFRFVFLSLDFSSTCLIRVWFCFQKFWIGCLGLRSTVRSWALSHIDPSLFVLFRIVAN